MVLVVVDTHYSVDTHYCPDMVVSDIVVADLDMVALDIVAVDSDHIDSLLVHLEIINSLYTFNYTHIPDDD